MIAPDTNVLVRFLVEDDPAQTARASALVERAVAAGEQVFVAEVVLVETVWVLARAYRLPRNAIVEALRKLVAARHVALAAPERVVRALVAYAAGPGDFSDYLVREDAVEHDCRLLVTFDRALHGQPGFGAP
jgi:predicted nucleic-acid-binding protein